MLPRNSVFLVAVVALLVSTCLPPVLAADLTKKWRVSLAGGVPPIGGYNSQDEVESPSANRLLIVPDCLQTNTCTGSQLEDVQQLFDPREEGEVFGTLEVRPMWAGTLAAQYGVNKHFLVEGSVGWQESEVGDIEFSAQFSGNGPEDEAVEGFNFTPYRIPAGDLTVVPLSVSAIAHFRPRATFDPYLGLGIGYWIIGFDVNPEVDEISQKMDASRGTQTKLGVDGGLFSTGVVNDLQGATVNAQDSFAWHLVGGAEFSFKKRWSAFVDVRWVDVSRDISVGFNGGMELGSSVPNFVDFQSSERANATYGPVLIGNCQKAVVPNENGEFVNCEGGGLLDLGRVVLQRTEDADPIIDCQELNDAGSLDCEVQFIFEPDGEADPGLYYAHGGSFSYDGFAVQLGVRFTFGK